MHNEKQDCVLVVLRNQQDTTSGSYVAELLKKGYRVEFVCDAEDPIPAIKRTSPMAVCFHFDYPDARGLTDLRLTKRLLPSVPLLMITQAHSESLAVWAFRARVWDYFVQPVELPRFLGVMEMLRGIKHSSVPSSAARAELDFTNMIPPEARQRCGGVRPEQSSVDHAMSYVEANLHRKIVQAEVAELCGLSTFQFSRLFKRITNGTFQEYLLTRRITEAKRLLANPNVSVTDVCFTVGFHDLSYFTRVFQRYVGHAPSRYRATLAETPRVELVHAELPAPPSRVTGESAWQDLPSDIPG